MSKIKSLTPFLSRQIRLDEFHCFISSLMLAPTMVHTISEPLPCHAKSKCLFPDEEELCFCKSLIKVKFPTDQVKIRQLFVH